MKVTFFLTFSKGPVGKGYTCYCAPFFHNVEKKLEADKQELIDHIDHAHEDLNAKIAHLERKTRNQLFNLNQSVREKLAAEKTECLDRVERAALRERLDRERQQAAQEEALKTELQTYMRDRVAQVDYRCSPQGQSSDSNSKTKFSEVPNWSRSPRRPRPNGICGVSKAKSEEVLHVINGVCGPEQDDAFETNAMDMRVPPTTAGSPPGLFGNEVGLPPPPPHLVSRATNGRPDFEKLGAKPKYPLWEQTPDASSPQASRKTRWSSSARTSPKIARDFKSDGDLASYNKEDYQDEEKEKEDLNSTSSPSPITNGTCTPAISPTGNGCTEPVTASTPPLKPAKPALLPRPLHPPPYSSHVHRFTPSSQARPLRVTYVAPNDVAEGATQLLQGGTTYDNGNSGAVEDQLCKLNEGLTLDPENGCSSSEV